MTEDQMWNLSDEELEKAFLEDKASYDISNDIDEIEDEINNDIEDTENIVDDMEQPGMDSDDDTITDEEVSEDVEEDSDEEVSDLDEGTKDSEEQTTDTETKADTDVKPVAKHKVKANNMEYEFSEDEMLKQFPRIFGQAMDYTRKMQAIKPLRKTIDLIEGANLSHEDLNLAIDILRGDKEAIATILKKTGVDALDLDVENSNYVPKDYGRNDTELAIKDVVDTIKTDREFTITESIISSQWDDASRRKFVEDPRLIKALHIDVQNGDYDKVAPIAAKLKVYDGGSKSDFDYYIQAAGIHGQNEEASRQAIYNKEQEVAKAAAEQSKKEDIQRVKATQAKQVEVKQASMKRKAAAPTMSNAGMKKSGIDYLDDSDEGFEAWYEEMKARQ